MPVWVRLPRYKNDISWPRSFGGAFVVAAVGIAMCVHLSSFGSPIAYPLFPCLYLLAFFCRLRTALIAWGLSAVALNLLVIPPADEFSWPPDYREVWLHGLLLAGIFILAPRRIVPIRRLDDGRHHLPFLAAVHASEGRRVDHWSVRSTGDYTADAEVGRAYARMFVGRMAKGETHPQPAWIIRDMVAKGRFTGVEVGFVQAFAQELRALGQVEALRAHSHPDQARGESRVVQGDRLI